MPVDTTARWRPAWLALIQTHATLWNETEAQMRFLRDHLCDEIQGFWLSVPLEPHRCLAFIRSWAPAPAAGVPV